MLLYTRGLKMTYIRLPVNKSKEKKEILLTRLPNHFTWSQMSKVAFTNYVPNFCPFLTTYLGDYIYSRGYVYSRLYSKYLFTPDWHLWRNSSTVKVRQSPIDFFKQTFFPIDKRTNSTCGPSVFRDHDTSGWLFFHWFFWKKLKTPKRYLVINWPLQGKNSITPPTHLVSPT